MINLKVGDKAPDFTLFDTEKNEVSLSAQRGKKTLVVFFPLAFTSVCTSELCALRDDLSLFEKLNTNVLAISVDSPFTLAKFKAEQSLNFPLLSDFNKTTAAAYGALYETFVFDMKGVAKRSAFVVDENGTIQYAEVLESAGDLPNFAAIKQVLQA